MDSRAIKRSLFYESLSKVLIVIISVVAVVTLGSRLGRFHWSADWLAYFHDSYFFLSVGVGLGFLWLKRYSWAALAVGVALFNAWLLLPYFQRSIQADTEGHLRLYSHNLYYQNNDLEAIRTDVETYDPDIVFLMEYSAAIQAAIEAQFDDYPYRLIEPSRYTMGLALFSRIPFERAEVVRLESTRIPVYSLEFFLNGQTVSFVGGHPWPPLPRWGNFHRAQMQTITEVAADAKHPLIVAGDFNASPWSYTVNHLRKSASVEDARLGFGLRKTWRYAPVLALPIDQILVSDDWRVLDFAHGNWGGSDHAPLIVDLALPASAE